MFIQIEDARKEYVMGQQHVRALAGVSINVERGEFVALMGPSGSGKSTLLNILGGLDRPTHGTVLVGDQELTKLPPKALCRYRQQQLGFIFQKFNLLGTQTALENVEFPQCSPVSPLKSAACAPPALSNWLAWATGSITAPVNSLAASSNAWLWHGRWSATHR